MSPAEKVEKLREHWKELWRERIDDKVRAEGISKEDYPELFVDRGTVIFATRAFKPLDFKKILEKHGIEDLNRYVPPSPEIGGWGKFIRTVISNLKHKEKAEETRRYLERRKKKQHVRKGGRGWLRA